MTHDIGLLGIQNPSFEQQLSFWQFQGAVGVADNSVPGLPSPDGLYHAFVINGSGVTDANLEGYLGLAPGSLDNLGNGDAINGGVLNQTFEVQAGDTLTFTWNFLTSEAQNSPYNDFAFVSIKPSPPPSPSPEFNVLATLANTNTPLLPTQIGYLQTGFKTYSYAFPTAGIYTIAVGSVNEEVNGNDSVLLVDNFTLGNSDVAPTLLSLNPDDNSTGVAVNADLKATFSEPVKKGMGDIVIKQAGGAIVEMINVASNQVTISGNTVTINPTNNLPGSTDYYVEVSAGAIEDFAGNDFAGITGDATWNFTTGINAITGTANGDNLIGTNNKDIINGLEGNDTLNGLDGNDLLIGQAGDDSLNGGLGIDQFEGGIGNDIYVVDNTADSIIELADQGTDLVQSSVSYTLSSNVENLTLTGVGAINATGNASPNALTGNSGSNTLDGLAGADQLIGLAGNDTYVVDNASDVVTEATNAGIDGVQSSITYTLPVNVENLILTGEGAINATGNNLVNTITGNSGNNILNGLAGADFLIGNAGNDTYVVNNAGDVVAEATNAGIDTVKSSITYTLSSNVENLILTGIGAINGTGNNLVNTITGNNGNNILDGIAGNDIILGAGGADQLRGGAGTDSLTGGAGNDSLSGDAGNDSLTGNLGADKFVYNTNAAFALAGVGKDIIADFTLGQADKIVLDKTSFTAISSVAGVGFSVATEFASVATDAAAATIAADIVYNTATGGLFYNANGATAGFGTGGSFATLTTEPALTANAFEIQA